MIAWRAEIASLVLLSSLGGCASSASAQRARVAPANAAVAQQEPSRAPLARALLWRVSRGGRASYLFGTMHIGLTAREALGAEGLAAFERSSVLCVETVLTESGRAEAREVLARGRLAEGQSLRVILGEADWRKLLHVLPAVDPAALERFEPWFAAIMVMGSLQAAPRGRASAPASKRKEQPSRGAQQLAADNDGPMDLQLTRAAQARGARVVGLESMRESIEAFANMSRETALGLLRAFTADPTQTQAVLGAMTQAYRGEEAEQSMDALATMMRAFSPEFAELLLDQRNDRWAHRLEPIMREGGAFVAVGAAHMGGGKGLIRLLRGMGYEVTRVRVGEITR